MKRLISTGSFGQINMDNEKETFNKICVADFEVVSSNSKLTDVESCMDRLIKNHKTFSEGRNKIKRDFQGFYS